MITYKKVKAIETIVRSVNCNKCGRKIKVVSNHENISEDYLSINYRFGYGSLLDGKHWQFDLCELCLINYVNTFKIKVTEKNYE